MNYDRMTDEELIRYADGQGTLVRVLCERLEMRLRNIEELEHLLGRQLAKPEPDPRQGELFI
jgi:hypothetical protein